ncbi:MAG: LysM peptidoglycan-binding domain-containing protein [Anaerolineae bacterium]|nr:LysM peptidoglycan-binding domain-containing protein [Anaerolineae bacterium]
MTRFKALLATFLLLIGVSAAQAQTNLLENPSFERGGEYHQVSASEEDGTIFNVAPAWNGWIALTPKTEVWMNEPPNGYPHSGSYKRSGNFSQDISRGFGTFTASVFQTVPNIPEGTTLRFRAWVYQDNASASGARTRVGIGVNSGSPVTGSITWSPWMRSTRSWQEVVVEATVPAGSVTVFIYSTQRTPNNPNAVYYEDAELIAVGEGDVNVGDGGDPGDTNATPRPPTATPQTYAPFVNPQEGDDSGRVVHTVQSGDTLAAISVAYGVPVSEIRSINNLATDVLQIGQQLLIKEGGAAPATSEEATATPQEVAVQPTATEDRSSEIVVAEPTTAPTELPTEAVEPVETTEEVTAEPTSDIPPTITLIPATATEAPPAPIESGSDANPVTLEAAVCVLMFEDTDQNRIQGPTEGLLADGVIRLNDATGFEVGSYVTDGVSEPFCFEGLETGSYTAAVSAPVGYGMTTPQSLVVNIQPGARFQLSFGAGEGVEVAIIPTPDDSNAGEPIIQTETGNDAGPSLQGMAGLIVLGVAGVVLVGGAVVALIARRL